MGVDVPQRVAQMGFTARTSGVPRHQNPYVKTSDLASEPTSAVEVEHELAGAWWDGWDRADIDLRNEGRQPR